jgi:hypothetical protein
MPDDKQQRTTWVGSGRGGERGDTPDPSSPLYHPVLGDLDQLAARARAARRGNQPSGPGGKFSRLAVWAKTKNGEARASLEQHWKKSDTARADEKRLQQQADAAHRDRVRTAVISLRSNPGGNDGNTQK